MDKKDEPVKEAPEAGKEKDEVKVEAEASPAEPDWKELLRLERERAGKLERDRDNYRDGMLSYKDKLRHKEDGPVDEEPAGEDKIKAAVAEALAPVVSALQGSKVDQILVSAVTDPAKREYVKSLYQTRIQKTGTSDDAIRQDIEAALSLADSTRFAKENEELKRMRDNGQVYVPPSGGSGGSDSKGSAQKTHKWTPEQERSLEQRARANGITDVEKYKALAWKAANEGSAFDLKGKYI